MATPTEKHQNGVPYEAPTISALPPQEAIKLLLFRQEESHPTEQRTTAAVNYNLRDRDEKNNVLARSAWVDPALPDPSIPAAEAGFKGLFETLDKQKREPTKSLVTWLYDQQLRPSVARLTDLVKEGFRWLDKINRGIERRNAEIDKLQQFLDKQHSEAEAALKKKQERLEYLAERGQRIAGLRSGRLSVFYDPGDPMAAVKELRARELRAATATEEKWAAAGAECEASYRLQFWHRDSLVERVAPQVPDSKDIDSFLTAMTWCFTVGAFLSIVTMGDVISAQMLYEGITAIQEKPAAVIWLAPCYAGAKTLGRFLTGLGEVSGARWFRGRGSFWMGLVSTTVALLVGLLGIAIDVITTHVGLLNATEDRTPEGDLTLLDHLGTWSPAAFFVLGYVLISFGAGAFKQWRLAQYELDSKEYASYLHEKQRRDLIASKGAAYKRQDTADGIKETAPRHIEVGELPQLRKLTVACNRVVTLRWEVKAISERIQVEQKSYEARTQAFNVLRQEPREQLSEAHRKLVEETAHTAHIEGMRFRWVLFQVVRDAELSPFFRWLRSWVWLFEPLWTRWRRFR